MCPVNPRSIGFSVAPCSVNCATLLNKTWTDPGSRLVIWKPYYTMEAVRMTALREVFSEHFSAKRECSATSNKAGHRQWNGAIRTKRSSFYNVSPFRLMDGISDRVSISFNCHLQLIWIHKDLLIKSPGSSRRRLAECCAIESSSTRFSFIRISFTLNGFWIQSFDSKPLQSSVWTTLGSTGFHWSSIDSIQPMSGDENIVQERNLSIFKHSKSEN